MLYGQNLHSYGKKPTRIRRSFLVLFMHSSTHLIRDYWEKQHNIFLEKLIIQSCAHAT